jgi:O-antigen ligase
MQFLTAVTVVVLAHVGLIFGSRKINLLFLLAGAFVTLSLLSVAIALSLFTAAKYARVYTTLLMVMCGIGYYHVHALDRTVRVFGLFVVYSLLCPMWGIVPLTGMMYKSFFVLTLFSGVLLAYSIRSWEEAQQGFRFLVLLTTLGTTLAVIFFTPMDVLASRRLQLWDINPVRIGETASTMMLLCGYVGLYDRSRNWRLIAWVACGLLTILIALAGSRSAVLVVLVGFALLAVPLLGRPRKLIPVLASVVLFAAAAAIFLRGTYGMQRIMTTTNTRVQAWDSNMDVVSRAPIFGHGWIYVGREAGYANLHSMYFQILAEMGIVGMLLFVGCMTSVILRWYHVYRSVGRTPPGAEFVMLPIVFIAGALVMGLFEVGVLAGVQPDTMLLGFGIALVDRLPFLLSQHARSRKAALKYRAHPVPGVE